MKSSILSAGTNILNFFAVSFIGLAGNGNAAILVAANGQSDFFGISASVSGTAGLIGSPFLGAGSAFLFRNPDAAIGTVTESARLVPSDGRDFDSFGFRLSLSGSSGLVGSPDHSIGTQRAQGAAYLFRNLNTATGTVTQNAKLIASDGVAEDFLGQSVSLSGNIGLVAGSNPSARSSAYLFRNLNVATGTVTQNAKLIASDGVAGEYFGDSMSVMGNTALIGAGLGNAGRGAAYLFRNLDTATGTVTQNARLIASDGVEGDTFFGISLTGNIGVVGAGRSNGNRGSVYVFRGLDTATGTITEEAKLTASDGAVLDNFGYSVSISGSNGLAGAGGKDSFRGAAYLFRNVDTVTGTVTESVKVTASNRGVNNYFGESISLDGDLFVIGAVGANNDVGKAYAGSVSAMTTLDAGSVSRRVDGLSFTSREDWIIGEATDANQVSVGVGDAADVTAAGKAVYIGRNADSDGNTLRIDGILRATEIYMGSPAGNTGNLLQLEDTAAFTAGAFRLAPDNLFRIKGNFTAINTLLTYLRSTSLQVWDGGVWRTVDNNNHAGLIVSSFTAGYTEIAPVPRSQPGPPPTLTIVRAAPGTATLAWQPASPGFVLQENSTLDAATWQNSASGAQNPVTVPAGPGSRFFRLRHP